MATYILGPGGSHSRYEGERGKGEFVAYEPGDEIELTDEEAASDTFKGRLLVVEASPSETDEAEAPADEPAPKPRPRSKRKAKAKKK